MNGTQINEILTLNGLATIDRNRLMEIAKIEGKEFEHKLLAARDNDDEAAREYLSNVIKACAPFCRQTLENSNLPVDLPTIIAVAKAEGSMFFKALNAVSKLGIHASDANIFLRTKLTPAKPEQGGGRLPDYDSFENPPVSMPVSQPPAMTQTPARPAASAFFQASPKPQETASNEPKKHFASVHVYAGKAALCFSEDQTQSGNQPTVRIEVAPSTAPRTYDWSRKISIQMSLLDLYAVLAVLSEQTASAELSGRGATHDKFFAIERQEGNFFVKMGQKGVVYAVPVDALGFIPVHNLLLRQIFANDPHLSEERLNKLLATHGRMSAEAQGKRPQRRAA